MPKFIRLIFLFILTLVSGSTKNLLFSQESRPLSVTVDGFTVKASPYLGGKVDSLDLLLAARAVVGGDSLKHGWLLHFTPIELRTEERYGFFPKMHFFRFFPPHYKIPPGHMLALDRERGKAYLLYQNAAADDLGDMVLGQGLKISSDSAALEYFLEVIQMRGYLPVLVLDTIAEIRQFARYRERSAGLSASELPPVMRLYRHLWKDKNFAAFKKGNLPEERDSLCRVLESRGAEAVQPPAVAFNKGQYLCTLVPGAHPGAV